MRSNRLSKTTNHVKKDSELEVSGVRRELKLGEVIWVKTNPSSWWLGQIVDEDTVSMKRKPKKKFVGEVLVRLYGSYTYLYANPEKYHDDLMETLKQNSGSTREMFKKALEQEIAYTKSSSLKRKISENKEKNLVQKARDGHPKDEKLKQNGDNKNQDAKGFPEKLEGISRAKTQVSIGDLSSRRTRERNSGRTRKENSKNEIPKQDEVNVGTRVLRTRKAAKNGDISLGGTKRETSKTEAPKQDRVKKGQRADIESFEKDLLGNSTGLSSRRVKVMQSLGFVAPSGSPFKQKKFKLT